MALFPHITGLILAGGSGRRLGGQEKSLLKLGPETFIDHLTETFKRLFGRTIILTNTPDLHAGRGVRVVQDLIPHKGAVMGLITGLLYAPTEWTFVTACDAPLLQDGLAGLVIEAIEADYRVILTETPDGLQPLTAAYHRDCRIELGRMLDQGERSFRALFDRVPVKTIGPGPVAKVDPRRLSFLNVNTAADLAHLEKIHGDPGN